MRAPQIYNNAKMEYLFKHELLVSEDGKKAAFARKEKLIAALGALYVYYLQQKKTPNKTKQKN